MIGSQRRLLDHLIEAGAVNPRTPLTTVARGSLFASLAKRALQLNLFMRTERGNQATASLIASYGIEFDLARLMKYERGVRGESRLEQVMNVLLQRRYTTVPVSRRRLARRGLDPDTITERMLEGKQLTPLEMDSAMQHFVDDTQFRLTLATTPIWFLNNPHLRNLFKFKTFGIRQTGLLYNTAAKETFKGNPAPLLRFMMWTFLAGEIWNLTRDLFKGEEESVTMLVVKRPQDVDAYELRRRVINNVADGGLFGWIADIMYDVKGWPIGPVGSTVRNLSKAASDLAQEGRQTPEAFQTFITKEFVGVNQFDGIIRATKQAITKELDPILEYNRWRGRGFDWKTKKKIQERGGIFEEFRQAVIGAYGGHRDYERTDATLMYEYAARSIVVGDTKDAAEYLERIFLRSTNAVDAASRIKGAKNSMQAKSLKGGVSKDELEEFLSTYPTDERKRFHATNNKFITNYRRAITQAVHQAGENPEFRERMKLGDKKDEIKMLQGRLQAFTAKTVSEADLEESRAVFEITGVGLERAWELIRATPGPRGRRVMDFDALVNRKIRLMERFYASDNNRLRGNAKGN